MSMPIPFHTIPLLVFGNGGLHYVKPLEQYERGTGSIKTVVSDRND
jgi:hypothetical protein